MLKVTTALLTIGLLGGVFAAPGCSSRQYDPVYWHENFVKILQSSVGKKFDRARWTEIDLIDRTELPNGYVAYRYLAGGTCRRIFEADPKTDIVVAARWEGEAKHCIIIP